MYLSVHLSLSCFDAIGRVTERVTVVGFYCETQICIARLCCGNVSCWVCVSHASIVSERLNLSENIFDRPVAPLFQFSLTSAPIPNCKGIGAEAQNMQGVEKFAIST